MNGLHIAGVLNPGVLSTLLAKISLAIGVRPRVYEGMPDLQWSPLHTAAAKGNLAVCREIVTKFPMEAKVADARGFVPADLAAIRGFYEVAEILGGCPELKRCTHQPDRIEFQFGDQDQNELADAYRVLGNLVDRLNARMFEQSISEINKEVAECNVLQISRIGNAIVVNHPPLPAGKEGEILLRPFMKLRSMLNISLLDEYIRARREPAPESESSFVRPRRLRR